jgi:hypothetical protein
MKNLHTEGIIVVVLEADDHDKKSLPREDDHPLFFHLKRDDYEKD